MLRKIQNFNLKNDLIINLFKLILIKGIDNKNSKDSIRKESKEKKIVPMQNIQNKFEYLASHYLLFLKMIF